VSQETITALIDIVPQVLLIVIVAAVLLALRRPLLENVLPRVSRVSLFGIGVDLQPAQVRRALEDQGAPADRPMPTDNALGAIADRARRNAEVIRGRTVVWIDDHPEWTRAERVVLHRIGVFSEPVRTTKEAESVLASGLGGRPVDVLISDIATDSGSRLDKVIKMSRERGSVPVIFYVAQLRGGVPADAFGITNRPDELWHLVMDALERAGRTDR
jgi:hypothetical protein